MESSPASTNGDDPVRTAWANAGGVQFAEGARGGSEGHLVRPAPQRTNYGTRGMFSFRSESARVLNFI